jgi:hypothetical protein
MRTWGQRTVGEGIFTIFLFIYVILGRIPFVQNVTDSIMTRIIGTELVESFAGSSRIYGNFLLLPTVVLFIISVTLIMRRTIPSGRRFLYMLAGIGIPLCIMFLALVGGSLPPMRSLYALPLAFAFMFLFLIKTYKKKAAVVATCVALLVSVHQAQISAQLFYSDQMRYNEDVHLAYELNDMITKVQTANKKLPVAFVGKYQAEPRFHANFLRGEIIGTSVFSGSDSYSTTMFGLDFMGSLGINFDIPNNRQLDQALKEAASMPPYPDPGCVKRMRDFIVVRLTETLY